MHGQLPGKIKKMRQWAMVCSFPTRISHGKMNTRTDCPLLTICHHWQPIIQTEFISLLFTLFIVFTLISASYHPTQQQNVQIQLRQFWLCASQLLALYQKKSLPVTLCYIICYSSKLMDSKCVFLVLSQWDVWWMLFCYQHITAISQMCQI